MTGWWHRLIPGRSARTGPEALRWVLIDVEASGLDTTRDRLLAIAGVALHFDAPGAPPRIALGDSFELLLRQDEQPAAPDKANILLHGIGVGAQAQGRPPAEALAAFERWLAGAPLLAFHAAFDEALIQRDMQRYLGRRLPNAWADLAPVAQLLDARQRDLSLDAWLAEFHIHCAQRHQAAADALAEAELLLRLWPALAARGQLRFAELQAMARQRRWLT